MADSGNYPQLPRGVWRGAWEILRKTPKRKLDAKALAAELNVQPTAAKAYARELVRLGVLKEDFTPSELANRWRQDGQSPDVIDEMLVVAYPNELRELAPRDDLNRDKIVRWFMNDGLGEGSAKNKAATYIMVSSGIFDDAEAPPPMLRKPAAPSKPASTNGGGKGSGRGRRDNIGDGGNSKENGTPAGQRKPDLNVNVQIHISADASVEQIDAIFSSMRRYFDAAD